MTLGLLEIRWSMVSGKHKRKHAWKLASGLPPTVACALARPGSARNYTEVSTLFSFIKLQYKSIDLLASSLPGMGKLIPSGSEFVSSIAIIGIPNFDDSAIAKDS